MSSDPRLNSIHLEMSRRETFRLRRGHLLRALEDGQATAPLLTQLLGSDTPATPAPGAPGHKPPARESLPGKSATSFALSIDQRYHPLPTGITTLGRSPENDILFTEHYISRRHCAILVLPDGQCQIYDLASRNGTLVNGQRITGPVLLRLGDQIQLCNRQLHFLACSPAAPEEDLTQLDSPQG